MKLNQGERQFLNRLQGGFPIVPRPFKQLAERWGETETALLDRLKQLEQRGALSRFGLVLNPRKMGGDSRLASMSVPDTELEAVVGDLNRRQTVTHNYLREHQLNLWFVMSAENEQTIDRSQRSIAYETGFTVYDFPKLDEYYVGLRFYFHEDGSVETKNAYRADQAEAEGELDSAPELDGSTCRRIIRETQKGLPLVRDPYRQVAEQLGISRKTVVDGLRQGIREGWIKRIGCVPDHYSLGIRGNGMCVLNIPDDDVDEIGTQLGQLPQVTHCYRRPRYEPLWPYNLFAMVHERTEAEARETIQILMAQQEVDAYPHDVLFSRKKYKKTGLRI